MQAQSAPAGPCPVPTGKPAEPTRRSWGGFETETGNAPLKNGRRLHKIRKNGVGGLYFAVGILYTKTNTVLTPIRKVRLYDYH